MSVTVNGHVIGDKVGTKHMSFLVDDGLYSAYYALIQVDGRMMPIKSTEQKTGMVHASERKEARKLAIEARDRIQSRSDKER